MKALTIWQPWASLIAVGAKKYETRGWATNYRGPIAIHAAATTKWGYMLFSTRDAMYKVFEGKTPFNDDVSKCFMELPRGCIIGTAELVECHPIWTSAIRHYDTALETYVDVMVAGSDRIVTGSDEWFFGNWMSGHYAWELANVQILPEPIPAKGRQGLWNWEGTA